MSAPAHSVEVEPAARAVNPAIALLLRAEAKAFLVRFISRPPSAEAGNKN